MSYLPPMKFNGVKVFSATMVADRQALGDKVTTWLAEHPEYEIGEMQVSQSSDNRFHCLAITVFYRDPSAAVRTFPPR